MRIKLTFIGNDYLPINYKKVIFPLDKSIELIKDLKNKIIHFIKSSLSLEINVDDMNLKIDNFILLDKFEVSRIIKDNELVIVLLGKNSQCIESSSFLKNKRNLAREIVETKCKNEFVKNEEPENFFDKINSFKEVVFNNKNELPFLDNISNFTKIPSFLIEDIDYLNEYHSKLFKPNTEIYFVRYEFINIDFIKDKSYRHGKVLYFNHDTNSFLIEILDNKYPETEPEILNIPLKDFIDLYIEKNGTEESSINENLEIEPKIGCLRRQIEFYFSDENYYKDTYLQSMLNEENYVDIKLIMKFNRIKSITKRECDIYNALKGSKIVELDIDRNLIKKKSNK